MRRKKTTVNDNLKSLLQIGGFTSILLVLALVFVSAFGNMHLVWSVLYGYLVSLVNILFAFFSIKWAFDKPNTLFFAVILGGMGIRFLILVTALLFVWKFTQVPMTGFIASLVGFYITLQAFEIRFIQKELNNRKATV
jgi:hypothetical protein